MQINEQEDTPVTSVLRRILVTGATGYVGGRIVQPLLDAGYQVRVLVRDPHRLQGRAWVDHVDIAVGDVLKPETLGPAMAGIDAAYYFIHSMSDSAEFHQRDVMAARHFAQAARQAGVRRLIYLGGLGDPNADLSQHLRSRHQTGEALRQAGVPVTEFRSAIIVGSGSISFEMIRNLTERVPLMICPRWVYTRIQPISIGDVLDYLVSALHVPESANEIIEIGGADTLTYAAMLLGYARARGLKRFLIPVPVLTPFLSSYWVHWMTPVHASIARPLIEGLRNEVIVRDSKARRLFPHIKPVDYATAVRMALDRLESGEIETSWTDALVTSQGNRPPVVLTQQEGMIIEQRQHRVAVPAEVVFRLFTGLGGERGWLSLNWAWRLRGMVDRLVGGVGFRRGRRHPDHLRVGDALDFWRVEAIQPGRLLRLRAEMKVPGRAWLQFEARPQSAENTLLVQTAFFAPKGLTGLLYWYLLYPIHALIFSRLIQEIARRAQATHQQHTALPSLG